MSKRGNVFLAIGLLLLVAALFLTVFNFHASNKAGAASKEVMDALHEELPAELHRESVRYIYESKPKEDAPIPEMAVVEENGYNYIGILEIPALELSLPVMAEWDYDRLKISPCVYTGSYYTDDLVICAHNYMSHFGRLSQLKLGEEIYLTTVDGYVYSYTVDNIETVQPTEIELMTEATDWDLTVFTCYPSGATRCTVRCVLVSDDD